MVAPDVMVGKWKMTKSENFDEYMKAVGVGLVLRNLASVAKPTVEITKDDDTWKMVTSATFKTTELSFKLDGSEFEETTGDGRKVTTTMTWDEADGVLTQNQVGKEGVKGSVLTRTFKDDEMTLVLKVDDVVSTRVYKKVKEE